MCPAWHCCRSSWYVHKRAPATDAEINCHKNRCLSPGHPHEHMQTVMHAEHHSKLKWTRHARHPPGADGGHHGARVRSGDACRRRPITSQRAVLHSIASCCRKSRAAKPELALLASLAGASLSSLSCPSKLRCTEAAMRPRARLPAPRRAQLSAAGRLAASLACVKHSTSCTRNLCAASAATARTASLRTSTLLWRCSKAASTVPMCSRNPASLRRPACCPLLLHVTALATMFSRRAKRSCSAC